VVFEKVCTIKNPEAIVITSGRGNHVLRKHFEHEKKLCCCVVACLSYQETTNILTFFIVFSF